MKILECLDFEQPIMDLLAKIDELRQVSSDNHININQEIARLERKSQELTREIFKKLSDEQIVRLSRHPLRPHTLDYLSNIFADFIELFGDRQTAAGRAIVAGIARLDGQPVMVIGHQKGRGTKENLERNFGMANPEEHRRALRLMRMAEKFQLPIITFIDTPGAYPGLAGEERNQSEAIARNIQAMSELRTPIICCVIGEGGSGGALALGVGDRILMLQYSIYATISPEGCASILWRDASKMGEAAKVMQLTAEKLYNLKLIDEVVTEPLGGAHRNYEETCTNLKAALQRNLQELLALDSQQLTANRYQKFMQFGRPEAAVKNKKRVSTN